MVARTESVGLVHEECTGSESSCMRMRGQDAAGQDRHQGGSHIMTDELKDRDTMRRDFEREVYKREDESSAGENTVLLVTTPDESPRTAGPDRDPNAWALPVGEKINMVYLDLAEANQRISELENAIRLQAEDEQRDHQVKVELIQIGRAHV